MLISMENVSKSFTDKMLLNNQTLYIGAKDKIGIIGYNGCGKSTLLKILAKKEEPNEGNVIYERYKKITYLGQELDLDESLSALDAVLNACSNDNNDKEVEAKSILSKLGINDYDQAISEMSGGEKRKVSIARTLFLESDCLIIDEITNHLDSETINFLEKFLKRFNGAIVIVTHDRYFLERITNRICELYRGKLYFYEGSYSRYLELKAQRDEYALASERKRQAFLRKEYEWIKRGALARTTKSKKRIENYERIKAEQGVVKDGKVELSSITSRLGRKTIEAYNISKKYDDKLVIADFSILLENDARIGIIGKNGAGKTTLLKLLTGLIKPTTGEVVIGETVRIGYFSQENENLPLDKRVYDFISNIATVINTVDGPISVTQILERFLFIGETQYTPIAKLSGGEKRRLYLLSILVSAPNILVLDEPTNDLDLETLSVLEEYLNNFEGAVITVSHDRYFLDRVVDKILYLNDLGHVEVYMGNYSYFSENYKPVKDISIEKKAIIEKPKKVKMTFKEQREYEVILDEITTLETKVNELDQIINNNYANYEILRQAQTTKENVEAELTFKLERWEYLSKLSEGNN